MRLASIARETNLQNPSFVPPRAFGALAKILDEERNNFENKYTGGKPIATEYTVYSGGVQHVFLTLQGEPTDAVFLTYSENLHSADLTVVDSNGTWKLSGAELLAEISVNSLRSLSANWDGNGSPPPSRQSLEVAKKALYRANKLMLCPDRVVADSGGGVVLYYFSTDKMTGGRSSKYASLNIGSDGNVAAAEIDRRTKKNEVWEVSLDLFDETLARLHTFVR